jgi:hypothetical protein
MKLIKLLSLVALSVGSLFAQAPQDQTYTVKGDINVSYNTRVNCDDKGVPNAGVKDKYTLDINVANSARFRGTIENTPFIKNTFSSNQDASLSYSIDLDVLNPKNPAQARNVGKVVGTVPIDAKNVYHFEESNLKTTVFSMGTAKGFDSAFKGLTYGKPPSGGDGIIAKLKKEALNINRVVNGKVVTVPVTDYDRMDFTKMVISAGPVGIYPEAILNGSLIYDYSRNAWYFEQMTVAYVLDGRQYVDRLSGSIRWVESPMRKTNGEGQYEFDVRVNEPAISETAVFSGPADESAFFATDSSIPSLVGTMKYKDKMTGDRVTSSQITIDFSSTKLNKQQVMNLSKIFFLVAVVPLNAE